MADPSRLGTLAAQALADRTPIDWRALHRRAQAGAERLLVANLQVIAEIRRGAGVEPLQGAAAPPLLVGLTVVVAGLAATQTVVGLVVAAFALARPDPPDVSAPRMALALAFSIAAAPLAIAARRDRRSLFLLATFLTTASAFARTALLDLSWVGASPWMRLVNGWASDAFTPACLMLFALDFPRVHRFTRFDVAARRACVFTWLVAGVLFAANLAIDGRLVASTLLPSLYREHPSRVFWRIFTLGLALPIVAILVRARRAPPDERRRVAGVAAAIAFGSAPILIAGLVRTAFPAVDRLLSAATVDRRWFDTLVVAGLMAIPVLGSCAVIFERPFDVRAFRGFVTRASRRLNRAGRGLGGDPRRDVPGALGRLRAARGPREIEIRLAHELRVGIGARGAHLLVRAADGGWESADGQLAAIPRDGAIVAMLEAGGSLVDLSDDGPIWPLLPRLDRQWAATASVTLAAPIVRREGAMAAIVAITGRRDETLERADRWFVAALAPAVAAMWEIARADLEPSHGAAASEAIDAAFECPLCGDVSGTRVLSCGCDAAPTIAALPILAADKFLVRRRLGRGGIGIVYLARDVALDRDVVLKTLPVAGAGQVARLRREARAMASLRHEALATIHGLEVWRDTPVLVVEYFPCGTLAHRLVSGPLTPVEAIRIARQLASGLAHMHARGLLHCDIKPANIALTDDGSARLLDFGLAALAGADVIGAGGTPAYASPESRAGAAPSAACDLWGLSVSTLQAITGANPFAATRVRSSRLAASLATITPPLQPFFARALAVNPAARHQSAAELAHALDELYALLCSPRSGQAD